MIFQVCFSEHNPKLYVILSALIEMNELTFVTDKMDFCSGCVTREVGKNYDVQICTSLEVAFLIAH